MMLPSSFCSVKQDGFGRWTCLLSCEKSADHNDQQRRVKVRISHALSVCPPKFNPDGIYLCFPLTDLLPLLYPFLRSLLFSCSQELADEYAAMESNVRLVHDHGCATGIHQLRTLSGIFWHASTWSVPEEDRGPCGVISLGEKRPQ